MKRKGFTLIELLIVVAIIAILAAIAVPNFLEAQTRAKVSRAKADLRSMATAMESYVIDNNAYPPSNAFAIAGRRTDPASSTCDTTFPEGQPLYLEWLSTPISYITDSFLPDPFATQERISPSGGQCTQTAIASASPVPVAIFEGPQYRTFTYQSWRGEGRITICGTADSSFDTAFGAASAWLLQSVGPDRTYVNMGGAIDQCGPTDNFTNSQGDMGGFAGNLFYDPTNGTVSFGSIFRMGGSSDDHGRGLVTAWFGSSQNK